MDLIMPANHLPNDYSPEPKFEGSEKKKKGLPKPARNRSAFLIFSKEIRKKMASDISNTLNPNEQLVKIGQLWRDLGENEREVYMQKAKEDKIRYLTELKEFCNKFPCERIGNKTRNNHVKKCSTAYAIYLKKNKNSVKQANPKLRMVEIVKIIAENWKKLGEEERSVYEKEAREEKEQKNRQFFELALEKNLNEESYKKAMNKRKKKIKEADKSLRSLGLNTQETELKEPLVHIPEAPEAEKVIVKKGQYSQRKEKSEEYNSIALDQQVYDLNNDYVNKDAAQDLPKRSANLLSDLVNFKLA